MTITDYFTTVTQIKAYIRGIDASADITSFAPVYRPAAKKFVNLVGQKTYDLLAEHIETPPTPAVEELDAAVEYSRAALANLMAIPWFDFDSGSRNATDKKLYRYQEDKIIEAYLENAWAELDQLISYIEADIAKAAADESPTPYETPFEDFAESELYTQRNGFYIKSAAEFNKLYNINSSSYFYYNVADIMREVENENIKPRFKEASDDTDMLWLVKKAIAFETMSIACQRLDYTELPKGIRNDIIKEIGASVNRNELGSVKGNLATMLHNKALEYFGKIDLSLQSSASEDAPVVPDAEVNSEDNKYYLTL
jgi:hypothetical protein